MFTIRKPDYQRQRVYDLETELFGWPTPGSEMSIAECEQLASKLAMRRITVKDGRGRRRAGAQGSRVILLPRWSRVPTVVAHEVAHCLDYDRHESWHGPTFVGTLFALLYEIGWGSLDSMLRAARDRNVDVCTEAMKQILRRTR